MEGWKNDLPTRDTQAIVANIHRRLFDPDNQEAADKLITLVTPEMEKIAKSKLNRFESSSQMVCGEWVHGQCKGERITVDVLGEVNANIVAMISDFSCFDLTPDGEIYDCLGWQEFSPELDHISAFVADLQKQGLSEQESYSIATGVYDGPILVYTDVISKRIEAGETDEEIRDNIIVHRFINTLIEQTGKTVDAKVRAKVKQEKHEKSLHYSKFIGQDGVIYRNEGNEYDIAAFQEWKDKPDDGVQPHQLFDVCKDVTEETIVAIKIKENTEVGLKRKKLSNEEIGKLVGLGRKEVGKKWDSILKRVHDKLYKADENAERDRNNARCIVDTIRRIPDVTKITVDRNEVKIDKLEDHLIKSIQRNGKIVFKAGIYVCGLRFSGGYVIDLDEDDLKYHIRKGWVYSGWPGVSGV